MAPALPESVPALPLRSISHLSRTVQDLERSKEFYIKVLGFQEIKRPSSLKCEGAWLHGYGIALHLLAGPQARVPRPLNPKDDHTSFTTSADLLPVVEQRLERFNIPFVKAQVQEGGVQVTQVFFHCPDNHMIEVCNCDCIPVEPLLAPTCCKPQPQTVQEPQQKPVLDTCQMQQHAQSPLRGCGSMDLTSMHFPTAS